MYIDHDRKLIISKSFKTASSSFHAFISDQTPKNFNGMLVNNHIPVGELINHPSVNDYRSYTKVTLIRNPWDMVVSAFHWSKNNNECPPSFTFSDFVYYNSTFDWKKNKEYWNFDLIDRFIRYEYLEDDIYSFCEDFNFDYKRLAHLKKSIKKKLFWEYYDEFKLFYIVGRHYFEAIEKIGYTKFGIN